MKHTTILYNCTLKNSKLRLYVEQWLVGLYPLSYTNQECLEEFCESVGWKFVKCYGEGNLGRLYTFQVHRLRCEDILETTRSFSVQL